jgi:hypothetical protein
VKRLAGLVAAVLVLAGCGTPSSDLFVVERSGDVPDAKLKLLVSDGTTVECDGATETMTSAQLLDAREIAEDLVPLLKKNLTLDPGKESVLRFKVTGEDGVVQFSDSSRPLPQVFANLVQLTREISKRSCGRAR